LGELKILRCDHSTYKLFGRHTKRITHTILFFVNMSMDFAELSQCVTTVTKGEVREEATQLYSVWKVFWVYIQDGTCRLENTPVQAVAHPRVL